MAHKRVCNWEGCEKRPVRGKGLCAEHAELGVYTCDTDGCSEPVYSKGFCKAHYTRRWKKKAGIPTRKSPTDPDVRPWGEKRDFVIFTRLRKEDADALVALAGGRKKVQRKAYDILLEYLEKHSHAA